MTQYRLCKCISCLCQPVVLFLGNRIALQCTALSPSLASSSMLHSMLQIRLLSIKGKTSFRVTNFMFFFPVPLTFFFCSQEYCLSQKDHAASVYHYRTGIQRTHSICSTLNLTNGRVIKFYLSLVKWRESIEISSWKVQSGHLHSQHI